MTFLTLKFWQQLWKWCKVNWKFLIGFAIPCIILYFLNQKKSLKILKSGLEFRKKELSISENANIIERDLLDKNTSTHIEKINNINREHVDNIVDLNKELKNREKELANLNPESITSEIKDRFDIE